MIARRGAKPARTTSLHLTPDMLRAAYELLRTTPPFHRWKLPEGEAVSFCARNTRDRVGEHLKLSAHRVSISLNLCGQLSTMLPVMAHEMIHIYQEMTKRDKAGVEHNADFYRLAAQVCRHHGFDVKAF